MKISLKWLKEYVDFDLSADEVASALTSTGLEVASVEESSPIRGGLKGLFVGEVVTCEDHPNSDHLHITQVDLGRGTLSQIVCGAPNVAKGQKVIVADLGCVLYDGEQSFEIKKSKLRGVESFGMICAEDEIGVGTSHDGIIVLPSGAVVGTPAATYYNIESDWVIEIEITANRSDALSHWGVARDLYAWLVQNGYKTQLHRPSEEAFKVDDQTLPVSVEIENEEACPRYACVSLTDCEVKESPQWLKDKLSTVGLRPINNIVDITNYIMMAYGQPMHCFDADMVKGHKIVVRTQPEGTRFITLDGEEHLLGTHDLSICNAEEPMCIAGIFGGKGSGTYETTRNVVFESAYFHPTWIRKSARRHGLSTDASYRFERGIDPDGVIYALKQAAILAKELTGCKVSMDIVDVYPKPFKPAEVRLDYDYVNSLIGKEIGEQTIRNIAESLAMEVLHADEKGLELRIPLFRVDVTRPCDVVEDILRIYGYNHVEIPTQLKSAIVQPGEYDYREHLKNIISESLVGCGFNEILNNSLTKTSYYEQSESYPLKTTVKVMNPLSSDLGVMRQTLLFGGLESIVRNVNRKLPDLRFFEFGNCYHYDPTKADADNPMRAYREHYTLGIWLTGKRVSGSWAHPDEDSSIFELKAYVMNVLRRMGIGENALQSASIEKKDVFADGMELKHRNGKSLAVFGIVSPKLLKRFSLNAPVYYAEIAFDETSKMAGKQKIEFKEISKYPPVSRDLALLVDQNISFAQIAQIAKQTEKKLLRRVELFDVYEGKNLPAGKKSYAVNFILQDEEKTMSDKQIEQIMNKIIQNLTKQLQAELR